MKWKFLSEIRFKLTFAVVPCGVGIFALSVYNILLVMMLLPPQMLLAPGLLMNSVTMYFHIFDNTPTRQMPLIVFDSENGEIIRREGEKNYESFVNWNSFPLFLVVLSQFRDSENEKFALFFGFQAKLVFNCFKIQFQVKRRRITEIAGDRS